MPLNGQAPFAMSIPTVLGVPSNVPVVAPDPGFFVGMHQREQDRLKRYAEYWRAYNGVTDPALFDPDDPVQKYNLIRGFVDAGIYFAVGAGFVNKVAEGLRSSSYPILEEVWRYNGRDTFVYDRVQTGSVTGDWFALTAYQEPTDMERRIRPYSQGQIRLKGFGSEQVFCEWDPLDRDKIIAARIETYFFPQAEQITGVEASVAMRRHTMTISRDQIVSQVQGETPVYKQNILGEIPLVHCKNINVPGEYYGRSDVQDLLGPQKDIDEKMTDISNAINYNGTPTLALFGAKAKQLDKDSSTFWAGLPEKAHFEVLRMGLDDVGAANSYIDRSEKTIHKIAGVPVAALGGDMAISNTSGVALNLIFMPLLMKTAAKRALLEPALEKINYFILRIAAVVGLYKPHYDLCKCGGRIVDVETGKMTDVWDPISELYVTIPERKKKCYRVDPQTLDFLTPKEVIVKTLLNYGVGSHVGELPFGEVKGAAADGKRSFWSMGAQKMAEGGEEAELPDIPVSDFPKEPEEVVVVRDLTSPNTGAIVKTSRQTMVLVPTDCACPQYVDPYASDVDFNDVLPKDNAQLSAELATAQQNGWVDVEYCQDQFPKIAAKKSEINARLKLSKALEARQSEATEKKQVHMELAASAQSESSVAGKAKANERKAGAPQ